MDCADYLKKEEDKREAKKEKRKNKRVKMNAKNCLCTYLNFNSFRLTEQDLATVGGGRTNLAANYVFRLKHNNIGKYMSVVAIYGIDIMHYSMTIKYQRLMLSVVQLSFWTCHINIFSATKT
ncbi:MAG: hypothetical protein ACLVAU_13325 [Ruminococcus sp.]